MAAETFYVNLPGEERDPNPRCKRNNSQQEARLVNATIKAYLFNYLKLEIAQIKSGLGFGSTACYNKNQNKCDPYDDSDVPYYMPHFCNYADCSTYTGCHIKDDYESGSSNSGEDSTVKTVEIFTGKRYKITFYNEGFFNTMSGIVNGIYADEDDVLSGYINFTAFDSNCSNPTVCNSGTKVSIGIGNIQDVEEIVDTSNNKPDDSDTTYEGEIKVMILGITATTIRSLVIRLGLINDNPDEATTYVDMEVGKTYHLVYSKNNTIYEIEGKLVDITELSKYWENGDHQFVRNIGDYKEGGLGKYPGSGLYDKKYNVNNKIGSKIYPDQPFYPPKNPPVPGMYGVPYEELSEQDAFLCCDKDKIHDVKFTFDTGTNGYQCFETVMLSSIRDCCNVSDTCPCPPAPPMPPMDPNNNAFDYTISNYIMKFTGINVDKVVFAKGKSDIYGIRDADVIETVTGVEDGKEYIISIPHDGLFTVAIYYRCVCPIDFFDVTVDATTNIIGSMNDHHNHCPCPPAPPMPNPDHDVSVEINGNEVHFKAEGDYLVIISSAPDSVKTMSDYLVTTYTDPKSIVAVAQNTFDTTNPVLPGNVDFTSTIEYGHYCYTMYPIAVIDNAVTVVGPMVFGVFDVEEAGYTQSNLDDLFISFVQDIAKKLSGNLGLGQQPVTTRFNFTDPTSKVGTVCVNADALDPETYLFQGDLYVSDTNVAGSVKQMFAGDIVDTVNIYGSDSNSAMIYGYNEANNPLYNMISTFVYNGLHSFANDCDCKCLADLCACDINESLNGVSVQFADKTGSHPYTLCINFTTEATTNANNAEIIGKMLILMQKLCEVTEKFHANVTDTTGYVLYHIPAFNEMIEGMSEEDFDTMSVEDVFNYLFEFTYRDISKDASAKYLFKFLNNNPSIVNYIINHRFGNVSDSKVKAYFEGTDTEAVDILSGNAFAVNNVYEDPWKNFINGYKKIFSDEFLKLKMSNFVKYTDNGVEYDQSYVCTHVKSDDERIDFYLGLEYKIHI